MHALKIKKWNNFDEIIMILVFICIYILVCSAIGSDKMPLRGPRSWQSLFLGTVITTTSEPLVLVVLILTCLTDYLVICETDFKPPPLNIHLTEWTTLPGGERVSCPERRRRVYMEALEAQSTMHIVNEHHKELSSFLEFANSVEGLKHDQSGTNQSQIINRSDHRMLSAAVASQDVTALLALKNSIRHDPTRALESWKNSSDHCATWAGVTCNQNGEVVGINLSGRNLTGTITPLIGNFTHLSWLNLSTNFFTGIIPPELGSCHNLSILDLRMNRLTGEIPSQLGNLTQLQFLWLSNNTFSGSAIPSAIANSCQSLRSLDINYGGLLGPIPVSLGGCLKLEYLTLTHNNLSGGIPTNFGALQNLRTLNLAGNQLSGTMPVNLMKCRNMRYLSLSNNNFSGTIPAEIGLLTNLKYLYLANNRLSGEIPPTLKGCRNMSSLSLMQNNLTGKRLLRPSHWFCPL